MLTTLARVTAPKGRLPRAMVPQIKQTQTDDIPCSGAREQPTNKRGRGSRKRQSRKACKRAMPRYAWLLSEGTWVTKTKQIHVTVVLCTSVIINWGHQFFPFYLLSSRFLFLFYPTSIRVFCSPVGASYLRVVLQREGNWRCWWRGLLVVDYTGQRRCRGECLTADGVIRRAK